MQVNNKSFILIIKFMDDKNGKAGTKAGYMKLWRAHTPRQDQYKSKGIPSLLANKSRMLDLYKVFYSIVS
jgi:hypothetical protein